MKIAIYGGSFNPIHFGHIGMTRWVAEHTDVDKVWLMVTPNNPLKPASMLADEQQRLQAARDAVADIPNVEVSDFEFSLPRPSYTANTLRHLQQAYPEHRFALLMGQDNWELRTRWREWDYIEQHFPVYVYPRGERNKQTEQEIAARPNVVFLGDAPHFDISSTEIRNRIKEGMRG